MDKTALFSIAVVFYVYIFIISAAKASEDDVIKPQKELTNHIPVDTFVNKEFNFNNSELKAARAEECKCKNGKCMRSCDITKTTPCENQKMVCVCNPEFGKIFDDECEYCDCGQGINCTFVQNIYGVSSANCICPEGYYKEYYPYKTKCKRKCSSEQPCQNGGTCNLLNRCECPYGIKGDLCEEIDDCSSKCENRFEVDCLYNERYRIAYCNCKNSSLYFDQEANICKPCPCENGLCDYEYNHLYRKLICKCNYGYKEFNGYCKKCQCGLDAIGQCEFDSRGESMCKCRVTFFEREGRCMPCGCYDYRSSDTKCEVTGNVKRCFCREGFQDVNGYCEDIDECETNNTCHPSTTCYNTYGSFDCKCPDGYEGRNGRIAEPGEACKDINECNDLNDACWYWNNVKCVNIPGSYKCECLQGYKPSSFSDDPQRTTCLQTPVNAAPAVIVVFTVFGLILVSWLMHDHVKKKAARSN